MRFTPLNAVIFLKEMVVAAIFFFLPVWLLGRGAGGGEIGALMGAYTITGMLLVFPSGILSDGVSSRRLVSVGLLGSAAGVLCIARLTAFPALLPAFVLLGVSDNLSRTALQTVVFKTLPGDRVGALARFNFDRCAGCAAGLLGGALLVRGAGFDALFHAAALLSFLLAFAARGIPETPSRFLPLSSYRDGFLRRDVLLFSGAMFLFAFHWGAEGTSYALFVRQTLGLGWAESGVFMAIPILALAGSSFRVAAVIRRAPDYGRLLIFGFVVSGAGHVAMTVPVVWASFSIRILHEIGDAIVGVVMLHGMSEFFPAESSGGLTALFTLVNTVGTFLGALAYGPLGAARGYGAPLAVSGVLSLLAVLPALAFRRGRRAAAQEAP